MDTQPTDARPTLDATIQDLRDGFNRLRGRLFEAVEATGVADRHQTAIKGLIRGLTYDMQGEIEGTVRRARGALEARE